LEIIVTDDCSTDETYKIVSAVEDNRLQVFKHESNLGRVRNYNYGLYELAKGSWVLNLDGDDYLLDPYYITDCISLINKYEKISFVQSDITSYENKAGKRSSKHAMITGKDYLLNKLKVWTFNHMTTLYNREMAVKSDYYTNDILSTDAASILRLCKNSNVIVKNGLAGYWRPHGENISLKSSYINKFNNYTKLLHSINQYYEDSSEISKKELEKWTKKMQIQLYLPILISTFLKREFSIFKEAYRKFKKQSGKIIFNHNTYVYIVQRLVFVITKRF